MRRLLYLVVAMCLTSSLAFAVHIDGEPHLDDILIAEYGSLGALTFIDPDDGIWFQNAPNQISVRAIAKYSDADQTIGLCDLCDGSPGDTLFLDPTVTTNGMLNLQLTANGSSLFDFAAVGGFAFLSAPSGAPAAPVTVFSQDSQNPGGVERFRAFRVNSNGRIVFAIEDWTEPNALGLPSDQDFNDIVIEVSGIAETPEPGPVLLTMSGLGLLALLRRRNRS